MLIPLFKNLPFCKSYFSCCWFYGHSILELRQYGLIQHWEKNFAPQPNECATKYSEIPNKPRISLKNLSGAFLLLIVGLSIATLVFIIETIVYYHKKNFVSQ